MLFEISQNIIMSMPARGIIHLWKEILNRSDLFLHENCLCYYEYKEDCTTYQWISTYFNSKHPHFVEYVHNLLYSRRNIIINLDICIENGLYNNSKLFISYTKMLLKSIQRKEPWYLSTCYILAYLVKMGEFEFVLNDFQQSGYKDYYVYLPSLIEILLTGDERLFDEFHAIYIKNVGFSLGSDVILENILDKLYNEKAIINLLKYGKIKKLNKFSKCIKIIQMLIQYKKHNIDNLTKYMAEEKGFTI